MKNFAFTKIALIIIFTSTLGIFAMPESWKELIPASEEMITTIDKDGAEVKTPTFMKKVKNYLISKEAKLGLDLAGGRELDYKIDLSKVYERNNDDDPTNDKNESDIINGVAETLRRRIDPEGTRELIIQSSDYGDEKHVIVDLTADIDNEETRAKLQKQIDLQFKEEKQKIDDDARVKEDVKKRAEEALQKLKQAKDFKIAAKEIVGVKKDITFEEKDSFKEQDQLNPNIVEKIWDKAPGTIVDEVLEDAGSFVIVGQNVVPQTNYSIYRVGEKKTVEREIGKAPEDFDVVRDQITESEVKEIKVADLPEQFKNKVLELKENETTVILENDQYYAIFKLLPKKDGSTELTASQIIVNKTKKESDETSIVSDEGLHGAPSETDLAAATATAESADKTDIATSSETPAKVTTSATTDSPVSVTADSDTPAKVTTSATTDSPVSVTADSDTPVEVVTDTSKTDPKEKIEKAYERLKDTRKKEMQEKLSYERLNFTVEISPWQDTKLTGEYFKKAKVGKDQLGFPQVEILFNSEGARLFEEISERNIGKPLAIFVGGELISAPRINEKISGGSAVISTETKNINEARIWSVTLARDLESGAIPAPITLSSERKVDPSLGKGALEKSIYAGVIGFVALSIWMVLAYRLLGFIAVIALVIYTVILIFIIKTSFPVSLLGIEFVLTLSGIAGIVLSIGVAVDANILIFERMREELRDGKNFSAALSSGFDRAWTSIRDSNLSSLITCAILYIFGTSVIRGFAVTLSIGILVSMFTAITITRTMLSTFIGTKISSKSSIFVGGTKG